MIKIHTMTREYQEGYNAGVRYTLGDGKREYNPYNKETQETQYGEWERGFDAALFDS